MLSFFKMVALALALFLGGGQGHKHLLARRAGNRTSSFRKLSTENDFTGYCEGSEWYHVGHYAGQCGSPPCEVKHELTGQGFNGVQYVQSYPDALACSYDLDCYVCPNSEAESNQGPNTITVGPGGGCDLHGYADVYILVDCMGEGNYRSTAIISPAFSSPSPTKSVASGMPTSQPAKSPTTPSNPSPTPGESGPTTPTDDDTSSAWQRPLRGGVIALAIAVHLVAILSG